MEMGAADEGRGGSAGSAPDGLDQGVDEGVAGVLGLDGLGHPEARCVEEFAPVLLGALLAAEDDHHEEIGEHAGVQAAPSRTMLSTTMSLACGGIASWMRPRIFRQSSSLQLCSTREST